MIDERIIAALELASREPPTMADTGHDVGLIADELERRLAEIERLLRSLIDDPDSESGW